jgi:hypothetical protein
MQAEVRTGDPAKIGADLVQRFQAFYASGRLLPPEQPARLIVRLIAQDVTGLVVSITDDRARALLAALE